MENHIHSPRQMTLKRGIVAFEVGLGFFLCAPCFITKIFRFCAKQKQTIETAIHACLDFPPSPQGSERNTESTLYLT